MKQCAYLAIQSADSEQVVGLAGLSFIDEECEQLRLQVLIQPKFRRKGYGLEVVRGLLAFGFGALAVHRIVCECEPGNLAAQALFAKAGLRPEGESKLDRQVGSEWVSTSFFAILKQEFQPTQRFS